MEPYLFIIIAIVSPLIMLQKQKAAIAQKVIKKRNAEDKREMTELARGFIGKECLISAFDSNHQFTGIIKEVSDGAILVDNGGHMEAINLDFVIRIREHPKDKKGKKKSVVFD